MANQVQDPAKVDPKSQGERPEPEFGQGQIPHPGSTQEMNPKPDHGEESYRGLGRLEGKVALITGADSGIGRAVAIAFAREGADIVISHLPQEQKDGEETASWVKRAGRKARQMPGDLVDEQYCKSLVERAFQE